MYVFELAFMLFFLINDKRSFSKIKKLKNTVDYLSVSVFQIIHFYVYT